MPRHSSREGSARNALQLVEAERIDDAADAFLRAMRAQGAAPKTMESYTFVIERVLLPFARKRGLRTTAELTPKLFEALTIDLNERKSKTGRPLSKYSVKSYVTTLNRFMSWLGSAVRAQRPVKLRRVKKPIVALRDARSLEEAATTVRDQLIIRILADYGCRASELCNLTVSDLRVDQLVFNGKTDLQRPVYITPEMNARLRRYIALQRPKDTHSDRVFLSLRKDKRTKDYLPLTPSGIRQMVKGVAELAGYEGKLYPHLFRHSAATRLGNQNVPDTIISAQLGMSLETLARHYSNPTEADMKSAILRTLTGQEEGNEM